MYHLGFTGTRDGMTAHQKLTLLSKLSALKARHEGKVNLHHGDCVGADAEAHEIAVSLALDVTVHPPINEKLRAFCSGLGVVILPPKNYLARDKDIVDATESMIATPKTIIEQDRSGTWITVRYARKASKSVIVIPPL